MRKRRIIYSLAAEQDQIDIARWLTQRASTAIARRFRQKIAKRIKSLEYASERGNIRERERGLRVIGILPTIAVAFTVEEDTVIIHRILHNGRNLEPEDY